MNNSKIVAIHSVSAMAAASDSQRRRISVRDRKGTLDQSEVEAWLEVPGNGECANCCAPTCGGAETGAWASTVYGILLCTECAGVHRSLGDDRVLSLTLDRWTDDQIATMRMGGNAALRRYFNAHGVLASASIAEKYATPQAHVYRQRLQAAVASGDAPTAGDEDDTAAQVVDMQAASDHHRHILEGSSSDVGGGLVVQPSAGAPARAAAAPGA